ncbi:hypothetical protein RclHR1_02160011 [Rhizophagus clarus]|uniref:Proteophosphoglycan 5 n=1 Tax=Rhizophagus clarus TaxID=94130 RepID=A0A2Z6QUX2_9GLOM|nr:hypothetical protein RclHR1_02160011 [Rhizophagus clarus]GES82091.1 hypothetical protein RCL_jg10604.t1 [Rhizophagus clarus]
MVKYSSLKNDFNYNVPWYSSLYDWILIIIKLIALTFIIWNITYFFFIIFRDEFRNNDGLNDGNDEFNRISNDINDLDEHISIIDSQTNKLLETTTILFLPTMSSHPNIKSMNNVESTITFKPTQSQDYIKPEKTTTTTTTLSTTLASSSPTTSPMYDIGEPTSIIKTPNVNPISDVEVNQKYCQSDECRFLFAYYPPEQETQANQHFLSFLQLAERLNRIMVLTNVGDSHIFACRSFSFDFYYNVKKLKQRFPNVKFITQKEFQDWTNERYEKPDTFHGFISPELPKYMIKNVKPYIKELKQRNCLRFFDLKLNDTTIFKVFNAGDGEKFDKLLVRELNNTKAEVLLVKHEIRHQLFTKLDSMDYADHIIEAADSVSKKLRPYIASHWRMEHGIQRLMPKCADNLIDWLKDKQRKTGIENLYLATDYPLIGEGKKTQSTTWHEISEFNTIAIQKLNSSVNLNTWVSMNSFDYLPKNDKYIKNELMGAGIQGILDKLILVQADYFVSCPRFCGRHQSKFTKKIREARKKVIKEQSSHLKNIWDVWYRVEGVDSS